MLTHVFFPNTVLSTETSRNFQFAATWRNFQKFTTCGAYLQAGRRSSKDPLGLAAPDSPEISALLMQQTLSWESKTHPGAPHVQIIVTI